MEAQQAFDKLKQAMREAPILASPDFDFPFTLKSDTSGSTMEAVLLQRSHPIAFYSKLFCPRLQWGSTYVMNCMLSHLRYINGDTTSWVIPLSSSLTTKAWKSLCHRSSKYLSNRLIYLSCWTMITRSNTGQVLAMSRSTHYPTYHTLVVNVGLYLFRILFS